MDSLNMKKNGVDWDQYYNDVRKDFEELKKQYPFCSLLIPPSINPEVAEIRVVAVNRKLIEAVDGAESDFIGDYSKEIHLLVPIDYKNRGCCVYGAGWVNAEMLSEEDLHFTHNDRKLHKTKYGFQICVGTPESFPTMKNVILENVRTAENMLVAYERIMIGASDKLELIAYAHGDKGRTQFLNNRKRYRPKG